MIFALLIVAGQLSAVAAEVAVLRNGFSIRHERREQMGELTRLYTAEGYVVVRSDQIASFEKEELPVEQPLVPAPAAAPAPQLPASLQANILDLDQLVRDAGSKRQIDPDFINSVIKAESNFHARAVSPKGAQGLMQLMPGTAAKLGVKDAFDPRANIEAGTAYLSELLALYHNDPIKALAAYNAGAERVQRYHGVPPYRETRAYISRIVRDFNAKKLAQMKAAGPTVSVSSTAGSARSTTRPTKKAVQQQASAATPHSPPQGN